MNQQPTDKEKVDALRGLMSTIQNNTKLEHEGRSPQGSKEQRQIKSLLELLLGRSPQQEEVDRAVRF